MILGFKWLWDFNDYGRRIFYLLWDKWRNIWRMGGRYYLGMRMVSLRFYRRYWRDTWIIKRECKLVSDIVLVKAPSEKTIKSTTHISWRLSYLLSSFIISSLVSSVQLSPIIIFFPPSAFLKARLWSLNGTSGKQFGNPNLREIIWLQPPIMCWFGGIRSALRSSDFHFMFEL